MIVDIITWLVLYLIKSLAMFVLVIFQLPVTMLALILDKGNQIPDWLGQVIMILLSLLMYYLIGYLIGLFIEKIKKK